MSSNFSYISGKPPAGQLNGVLEKGLFNDQRREFQCIALGVDNRSCIIRLVKNNCILLIFMLLLQCLSININLSCTRADGKRVSPPLDFRF